MEENWRLTCEGYIVVGPSGRKTDDGQLAANLDRLHLRKVDLADEVRILNVGGYVGWSTRREIIAWDNIWSSWTLGCSCGLDTVGMSETLAPLAEAFDEHIEGVRDG